MAGEKSGLDRFLRRSKIVTVHKAPQHTWHPTETTAHGTLVGFDRFSYDLPGEKQLGVSASPQRTVQVEPDKFEVEIRHDKSKSQVLILKTRNPEKLRYLPAKKSNSLVANTIKIVERYKLHLLDLAARGYSTSLRGKKEQIVDKTLVRLQALLGRERALKPNERDAQELLRHKVISILEKARTLNDSVTHAIWQSPGELNEALYDAKAEAQKFEFDPVHPITRRDQLNYHLAFDDFDGMPVVLNKKVRELLSDPRFATVLPDKDRQPALYAEAVRRINDFFCPSEVIPEDFYATYGGTVAVLDRDSGYIPLSRFNQREALQALLISINDRPVVTDTDQVNPNISLRTTHNRKRKAQVDLLMQELVSEDRKSQSEINKNYLFQQKIAQIRNPFLQKYLAQKILVEGRQEFVDGDERKSLQPEHLDDLIRVFTGRLSESGDEIKFEVVEFWLRDIFGLEEAALAALMDQVYHSHNTRPLLVYSSEINDETQDELGKAAAAIAHNYNLVESRPEHAKKYANKRNYNRFWAFLEVFGVKPKRTHYGDYVHGVEEKKAEEPAPLADESRAARIKRKFALAGAAIKRLFRPEISSSEVKTDFEFKEMPHATEEKPKYPSRDDLYLFASLTKNDNFLQRIFVYAARFVTGLKHALARMKYELNPRHIWFQLKKWAGSQIDTGHIPNNALREFLHRNHIFPSSQQSTAITHALKEYAEAYFSCYEEGREHPVFNPEAARQHILKMLTELLKPIPIPAEDFSVAAVLAELKAEFLAQHHDNLHQDKVREKIEAELRQAGLLHEHETLEQKLQSLLSAPFSPEEIASAEAAWAQMRNTEAFSTLVVAPTHEQHLPEDDSAIFKVFRLPFEFLNIFRHMMEKEPVSGAVALSVYGFGAASVLFYEPLKAVFARMGLHSLAQIVEFTEQFARQLGSGQLNKAISAGLSYWQGIMMAHKLDGYATKMLEELKEHPLQLLLGLSTVAALGYGLGAGIPGLREEAGEFPAFAYAVVGAKVAAGIKHVADNPRDNLLTAILKLPFRILYFFLLENLVFPIMELKKYWAVQGIVGTVLKKVLNNYKEKLYYLGSFCARLLTELSRIVVDFFPVIPAIFFKGVVKFIVKLLGTIGAAINRGGKFYAKAFERMNDSPAAKNVGKVLLLSLATGFVLPALALLRVCKVGDLFEKLSDIVLLIGHKVEHYFGRVKFKLLADLQYRSLTNLIALPALLIGNFVLAPIESKFKNALSQLQTGQSGVNWENTKALMKLIAFALPYSVGSAVRYIGLAIQRPHWALLVVASAIKSCFVSSPDPDTQAEQAVVQKNEEEQALALAAQQKSSHHESVLRALSAEAPVSHKDMPVRPLMTLPADVSDASAASVFDEKLLAAQYRLFTASRDVGVESIATAAEPAVDVSPVSLVQAAQA